VAKVGRNVVGNWRGGLPRLSQPTCTSRGSADRAVEALSSIARLHSREPARQEMGTPSATHFYPTGWAQKMLSGVSHLPMYYARSRSPSITGKRQQHARGGVRQRRPKKHDTQPGV